MIVRALTFLATFVLLQLVWQQHAAASLRDGWVHDGVAVPAAFVAQRLTPTLSVRAEGTKLRGGYLTQRRGINIVNGCDGTDLLFLLLAAFVASPLAWSARLTGALIGVALVYTLNQLRILALFYADGAHPELFDALHAYLAPVVMVVAIVVYFYAWIRRAARRATVAI